MNKEKRRIKIKASHKILNTCKIYHKRFDSSPYAAMISKIYLDLVCVHNRLSELNNESDNIACITMSNILLYIEEVEEFISFCPNIKQDIYNLDVIIKSV